MLKAKVYWNFHRKCFSVQVNGRVVAHATRVTLCLPTFKVSKRGRERVLREKRKNVHAFVYGYVVADVRGEGLDAYGCARYNPYEHATFVDVESGREMHSPSVVRCSVSGGRPTIVWADWQRCETVG